MWGWTDPEELRHRRVYLIREADEERLARLALGGRGGGAGARVHVRPALEGDEGEIVRLLDMNGVPRRAAVEERFLVAEDRGRVVAAMAYRTDFGRVELGPPVADPWRGEARVAVALYGGAKCLARELGAEEILARTAAWGGAYPREAGYRRRGLAGWRWSAGLDAGERGWTGSVRAALHLPVRGASRG